MARVGQGYPKKKLPLKKWEFFFLRHYSLKMVRSTSRLVGEESVMKNRKTHRAMRSMKWDLRKVERLFGESSSNGTSDFLHSGENERCEVCDDEAERQYL